MAVVVAHVHSHKGRSYVQQIPSDRIKAEIEVARAQLQQEMLDLTFYLGGKNFMDNSTSKHASNSAAYNYAMQKNWKIQS